MIRVFPLLLAFHYSKIDTMQEWNACCIHGERLEETPCQHRVWKII